MPNKVNANGQVVNVQYEHEFEDGLFESDVKGHSNTKHDDNFHFVDQARGHSELGEVYEIDFNHHTVSNEHHSNFGSNTRGESFGEEYHSHSNFNANREGFNTVMHTKTDEVNEVFHFNSHNPDSGILI